MYFREKLMEQKTDLIKEIVAWKKKNPRGKTKFMRHYHDTIMEAQQNGILNLDEVEEVINYCTCGPTATFDIGCHVYLREAYKNLSHVKYAGEIFTVQDNMVYFKELHVIGKAANGEDFDKIEKDIWINDASLAKEIRTFKRAVGDTIIFKGAVNAVTNDSGITDYVLSNCVLV